MKREIPVNSLAEWVGEQYDTEKWGENYERMPPGRWKDWSAVTREGAVLRTPDGRRWCMPVWVYPDTGLWAAEDTVEALVEYARDHMMRRHKEELPKIGPFSCLTARRSTPPMCFVIAVWRSST